MAKQPAQANLGSILDRPASEIARPKPIPAGTYTCVVRKFEHGKSTKKGTEFVEFTLAPIQPGPEIDPGDLEFALTKPSGEKVLLKDRQLRATYYVTEDAAWRLKKFLVDCGIEEGVNLTAMINESINHEVLVTVKHTPSEDGETVYANVGGTAKVA